MAGMGSAIHIVSFLVALGFFRGSNCLSRNLDYAFNEGCNDFCTNKNIRLGHVTATGPNDTLHYLWDFTRNPTIFVVVTSPTAKLQIKWKDYVAGSPNSLNFSEKPIYAFGISIERFFEFNDVNDRARIDEVSDDSINELRLENFQWHHKNMTKDSNLIELYTEANNFKDPTTNETRSGSIKFLMQGFGTSNHSHLMPCLLHSANSTQLDIVIDHMQTNKSFSSSRFALELLILSENDFNSTLAIDVKRRLDDEFTPGIFEVIELTTPVVPKRSGYLQWRPVSYTHSDRDVTNSTGAVFYPVRIATADDYLSKNSLLYMYYGERMFDVLVKRMNVSFGTWKDGFYKETNYNTWTFIAGYGTPQEERFSRVVILIIGIGIGIPLMALVVYAVYMRYRRIPRHPSEEFLNG